MSNALMHSRGTQLLPRPQSRLAKVALANLPYFVLYVAAVVLVAMTDHNPASAQDA